VDIGYDGGFYATKAISGERTAHFESFAVRPSESLFSLNGHQTIIVSSQHGRYLCGAEAVKKALTGARKETAAWIETPEYLSLFCAALSELTEATQATVNLVTGLPLADYRRDKGRLRDQLLGTHQFVREGRRGQSLTVETVRVVPQAGGAVLALLLDDRGRIVRRELAKQKVGVLDAGGHTVNYLSVDGLSDIPSETQGTERGAWTVVRVVRDYLEHAHPGLARMSDHDVMDAIISGAVFDAGERVDLTPITQPIIDDIGQEIVDTASQYWGAGAATFRQIVVCGGGAYLWGDHIKRAFRQAVMLERPELANALGFYRFAVNQSRA
jgi:plasmid segregation protein ParM